MIVLDASALADILAPTPTGRRLGRVLEAENTAAHAPTLIDAEAASALRRLERVDDISPTMARAALADLRDFGLVRHPYRPFLDRAWDLRHNFTVYDALYVALAEALDASLLTTDDRLAKAITTHTSVQLL